MDANDLNCRVSVYGPHTQKNSIGEESSTFSKIKDVWASAKEKTGTEKNERGNTVSAEGTYRFALRSNAVPDLSKDMYFMYAGSRYDILHISPTFRDSGFVECTCKRVVE